MTEVNPESQLVKADINSVDGIENRSIQGDANTGVIGDENYLTQGNLTAQGNLNILNSTVNINSQNLKEIENSLLSIVKIESKIAKS